MKTHPSTPSESRALPVAAHTPGPWKIITTFQNYDIRDGNRILIARLPQGQEDFPVSEADANARLIAAAPELLARLEETEVLAVELMERAERIDAMLIEAKGGKRDCELGELTRLRGQLSKNRAALAKAKGQP